MRFRVLVYPEITLNYILFPVFDHRFLIITCTRNAEIKIVNLHIFAWHKTWYLITSNNCILLTIFNLFVLYGDEDNAFKLLLVIKTILDELIVSRRGFRQVNLHGIVKEDAGFALRSKFLREPVRFHVQLKVHKIRNLSTCKAMVLILLEEVGEHKCIK